MNRSRRDVRCDYLVSALEADAPAWCLHNSCCSNQKRIPNQSGFTHGTHLALQNCMSLIPKTNQDLRVGSGF